MIISRRSLFAPLALAFAAPAIVRASSLMPIRAFAPDLSDEEIVRLLDDRLDDQVPDWLRYDLVPGSIPENPRRFLAPSHPDAIGIRKNCWVPRYPDGRAA